MSGKSVRCNWRIQPYIMTNKINTSTIRNEASNGLSNARGNIAMARTSDPHSATAQFFINVSDNGFLDHKAKTDSGWGYTVFGEVVEGMDVVLNICACPKGPGDRPEPDVQLTKVTINVS